jgi:hypothetical protein
MVWFALPIDIALMMFKVNETGQESNCDVNSIPFVPDDAKVCFIKLNEKISFFFQSYEILGKNSR